MNIREEKNHPRIDSYRMKHVVAVWQELQRLINSVRYIPYFSCVKIAQQGLTYGSSLDELMRAKQFWLSHQYSEHKHPLCG